MDEKLGNNMDAIQNLRLMEKKMGNKIEHELESGFMRLRVQGLGWTPHPVIVIIQDHGNCIMVLLYSYCTTITGLGVHLR